MMNLVERIRKHSQPLEPIPTEAEPTMEPLRGILAVVFDVYGTLIVSGVGDIGLTRQSDRKDSIVRAFSEMELPITESVVPAVLEQGFLDSINAEQEMQRNAGVEYPEVDIRAVWKRCCEVWHSNGWIARMPDDEWLEHLSVEYECRVNPVWPMPGMLECLRWIAMQGMRLGIVSNAQFFTPLIFEACTHQSIGELNFNHESCVWSYEQLEAKPSTRLYEILAESLHQRYSIFRNEVLYIGNDLRNDVWPASQIGFHTALFAGDQRSLRIRNEDPRLSNVKPDRVITDLRQLPQIISMV